MEIDALGTFNMSKEVFNQSFSKLDRGVIINISAILQWNGSFLQTQNEFTQLRNRANVIQRQSKFNNWARSFN